MMRRFLPFFIICFAILAFSKLMSVLNSDSTVIGALPIHADNQKKIDNKNNVAKGNSEPEKTDIPTKVDVVDSHGNIISEVYNIDTSQIQKIDTCNKLYDLNFSSEEVKILQGLRNRNNQIIELQKDLTLKENMLESIRNNIEEKISRLEKLNEQIDNSDKSQGSGASYVKLIKIYEGMKPKDAAKIFDELQMSVMILVAQQMKENKLAAIVAEMKPEKARDLTMALATRQNVE
jgi:flagellar motility protein MotE (MotC chaperone)